MPISSALGSSALLPAGLGFRNKIINGDMRINQRGASTSSTNVGYLVDRWVMYAGSNLTSLNTSTDAPAGFTNSIYAETTTASGPASYHGIVQQIEGNNIADLGFGTAWAKPVVVSFWVKSTKTGIANFSFANNGNLRTYTTTYTIDVANTWEKKIIYINGDTSGTWLTTNGMGLRLWWDLGSTTSYNTTVNTWVGTDSIRTSSQTHNLTATLNARLYLTGVQLEQNYQPTPFEQRPIGVELQLCQRYYYRYTGITSGGYARIPSLIGSTGASGAQGVMYNPVPLRTLNGASSIESFQVSVSDNLTFDSGYGTLSLNAQNSSANTTFIAISSIAGTFTQGLARVLVLTTTAGYIGVSAEL
jgi:hypothetical protein